jgi:hypothetical protein
MFALQSSSVVVNAMVSFIQPAEMHRSEAHVPGSVGQRLEPDRQRGQNVGDVDPALLPTNAAVGRYPTNLEVLRVRDRLQLGQVKPIRWRIERRRRALGQRLVGPHLVKGTAEMVEAPLLGTEGGRGGSRGLSL